MDEEKMKRLKDFVAWLRADPAGDARDSVIAAILGSALCSLLCGGTREDFVESVNMIWTMAESMHRAGIQDVGLN